MRVLVRTHAAASQASRWTPRAAHFEPRALAALSCLASPWTLHAAHFEPRALRSRRAEMATSMLY